MSLHIIIHGIMDNHIQSLFLSVSANVNHIRLKALAHLHFLRSVVVKSNYNTPTTSFAFLDNSEVQHINRDNVLDTTDQHIIMIIIILIYHHTSTHYYSCYRNMRLVSEEWAF